MSGMPLDTPVRALSGGYKRRLALAIQLVRDPYVLCLDEPLAVRRGRGEREGRGYGEEETTRGEGHSGCMGLMV